VSRGRPRRRSSSASEADRQECVKDTFKFPAKNPEVIARAREVVKDATSAEAKVRMLLAYVSDSVRDEYTSSRTGLDVLREMKGDCSEHTLLFVSLCRSLGIPAREVRGWVYAGDEAQALGAHAWAEVAVEGEWHAVDPTWNQYPVDGSHLSLARKADGKYPPLLGLGVTATVLSCDSRE